MDDRTAKGYDDKKEFRCISCGTTVMATKFASAKKVQCDTCKAEKKPADLNILAEIESSKKSQSNSPRQVEDDPSVPSDKKKSKCIQCGKEVLIGKFASHNKTVCDECKGEGIHAPSGQLKIDMSKVNRDLLPEITGIFVSPMMIGNPRLRSVPCPACGHEHMKIVKIIDSNPVRGLVVVYQCHICLVAMTLSEQCITKLTPCAEHRLFNYRAEEIHDMLEDTQDVRLRNTVDYLMNILKEHKIEIEGNVDYTPPIDRKYPIGINTNVEEVLANEHNGQDVNDTEVGGNEKDSGDIELKGSSGEVHMSDNEGIKQDI